jgi:heme a synthase
MHVVADRPVPRWLHILAVLAVIDAALLLILGGFVTSFRVGMADPVWPTEPWYLASNFKVDFGYLVEHFHRIVGWSLGLLGVVLTFGLWALEPSPGVRRFGIGSLIAMVLAFSTFHGVLRMATVGEEGLPVYLNLAAMGVTLGFVLAAAYRALAGGGVGGHLRALVVIGMIAAMVQGLLGGIRVRYNELAGRELSAVHGVVGQIVFGLLTAVAVLSKKPKIGPPFPAAVDWKLRWLTLVMVAFTLLQIVWGAWIRHFPGALSNRLHLLFAFVVVGFATLAIKESLSDPAARDRFKLPARFLMGLITLQVLLGIEAWIGKFLTGTLPEFERISAGKAMLRTAHAHVGAWILAVSVVFALIARRNSTISVGPNLLASLNSEETPASEPVLTGR